MESAHPSAVEERVRAAQVEARARNISHNVRCLECGHQSIEESAADIAVRLRKVIRDDIRAGRSDEEIYARLTTEYGESILYSPAFDAQTAVLWLGPRRYCEDTSFCEYTLFCEYKLGNPFFNFHSPCWPHQKGRGDRSHCRHYFLPRTREAAGRGEDGGCPLSRHSADSIGTPNAEVVGIATFSTAGVDMASSLEVVGGVLVSLA